ncbi:MAG: hypothetical protein KatS3mg114_0648 [Planctomycetaceae bacterium]|nr:MAG: hypothetical protein KatS3mg114_0648 [Planctomycetaceae bacterium]
MELDDTVCYCFHITKRKIFNYLRVHRLRRASQLADCGGAGTGCGWCIPYLKRYFEQYQQGQIAAADPWQAADYERAREEYLQSGKTQRREVKEVPPSSADQNQSP